MTLHSIACPFFGSHTLLDAGRVQKGVKPRFWLSDTEPNLLLSECKSSSWCLQGLSRILGIHSQVWQPLPLPMGLGTWIQSCCAGGEHFTCPAAPKLGREAGPRLLLGLWLPAACSHAGPHCFSDVSGSFCPRATSKQASMVGAENSADTAKSSCCCALICCCCRLAERQTASGGLNGRPEKLQDVSSCQRCRVQTQCLTLHLHAS